MGPVARQKSTREGPALETGRSIIAHLVDGPLDGKEFVLYRGRRFYTPRVSRGALRRALRMSRRYAWYEVGETWEEDEVLHGRYDFLEIRGEPDSLDLAGPGPPATRRGRPRPR